ATGSHSVPSPSRHFASTTQTISVMPAIEHHFAVACARNPSRCGACDRGAMMVADQSVNIADSLVRWAEETPFRVALIAFGGVILYGDPVAGVWRAGAWLVAEGVKAGDRVGISLAGNSAFYLIVVYGLARIGAVAMQLPLAEPPAVRLALSRRFSLAAVIGDD